VAADAQRVGGQLVQAGDADCAIGAPISPVRNRQRSWDGLSGMLLMSAHDLATARTFFALPARARKPAPRIATSPL
jgi:hypothetical protein